MTATLTAAPTRADILAALRAFICQRPGLEPGNYFSDWRDIEGRRAYRQESREITADRADALALLDAVAWRQSLTAEDMLAQLSHGRLTWNAERGELDYCTGQYFCTEYRPAAARALASMLWAYWRECAKEGHERGTADDIRAEARRTFRSRRVLRFFN